MRLGTGELLVVLAVVLLVFGPNKLPQLGDALGKGIRAFKRASAVDEPPATADAEAPRALAAATPGVRPAPAVRAGEAAPVNGTIDK